MPQSLTRNLTHAQSTRHKTSKARRSAVAKSIFPVGRRLRRSGDIPVADSAPEPVVFDFFKFHAVGDKNVAAPSRK
jgi:hypothetical protein